MRRILGIGCLGLVVLGIGLIVLAVVAAGRTTPPAQTAQAPSPVTNPASAPGTIGQRVESAGIALTVNSVNRSDTLSTIQKAKPERVFVVIDVTLENATRDKTPYNPAYFKVKDAAGYEYTAQLAGPDNYLKSGEIGRGETVRGVVAFDAPSTATGLVVSYQPVVILGGYQTIRVALSQ